ncbi:MAG: head-tail adaptor protein [Pseudomonadota bacterium]
MSLPRLTRLMVLEAPVRTPDGSGGHTTTWDPQGSIFVDLKPGTGRQATGQIGALARNTMRAIVRAAGVGAPSRPKPGQRLREGTRFFRIDAVAHYDRGAHYLTCFVVEEEQV